MSSNQSNNPTQRRSQDTWHCTVDIKSCDDVHKLRDLASNKIEWRKLWDVNRT